MTPLEGWSWQDWSTDTEPWCIQIERLKLAMPTPEARNAVKLIMASTIASLGSTEYQRLVKPGDYQEGDLPVGTAQGMLDLYTRRAPSRKTNMVHWYSYTLMQERLALYRAAEPYAGRGLVSLHTDSIRIRPESWGLAPLPEGWRVKEIAA